MEWVRSEQVRGKKWSRCVVGEKKREMGERVVGHVCGGERGDQKKEQKLVEGIILYNICKCNPKLKLKTNYPTEKFI